MASPSRSLTPHLTIMVAGPVQAHLTTLMVILHGQRMKGRGLSTKAAATTTTLPRAILNNQEKRGKVPNLETATTTMTPPPKVFTSQRMKDRIPSPIIKTKTRTLPQRTRR